MAPFDKDIIIDIAILICQEVRPLRKFQTLSSTISNNLTITDALLSCLFNDRRALLAQ